MKKAVLKPEVAEKYTVVGYMVGPIGLTNGQTVNLADIDIEQADFLFANNLTNGILQLKAEKKKKSSENPG